MSLLHLNCNRSKQLARCEGLASRTSLYSTHIGLGVPCGIQHDNGQPKVQPLQNGSFIMALAVYWKKKFCKEASQVFSMRFLDSNCQGRECGINIPYTVCVMFSLFVFPKCVLPVRHRITRSSRRPLWRQRKGCNRARKFALLLPKNHDKEPRAKTSTAMPNRSNTSRCSPAARPCATGTGKSLRRQHFRRGRMRPQLGECSQIGGGLVRFW